jgi:hypothetical protein
MTGRPRRQRGQRRLPPPKGGNTVTIKFDAHGARRLTFGPTEDASLFLDWGMLSADGMAVVMRLVELDDD